MNNLQLGLIIGYIMVYRQPSSTLQFAASGNCTRRHRDLSSSREYCWLSASPCLSETNFDASVVCCVRGFGERVASPGHTHIMANLRYLSKSNIAAICFDMLRYIPKSSHVQPKDSHWFENTVMTVIIKERHGKTMIFGTRLFIRPTIQAT